MATWSSKLFFRSSAPSDALLQAPDPALGRLQLFLKLSPRFGILWAVPFRRIVFDDNGRRGGRHNRVEDHLFWCRWPLVLNGLAKGLRAPAWDDKTLLAHRYQMVGERVFQLVAFRLHGQERIVQTDERAPVPFLQRNVQLVNDRFRKGAYVWEYHGKRLATVPRSNALGGGPIHEGPEYVVQALGGRNARPFGKGRVRVGVHPNEADMVAVVHDEKNSCKTKTMK